MEISASSLRKRWRGVVHLNILYPCFRTHASDDQTSW